MFGIFRRLRSQRPETVLTPRTLVGRALFSFEDGSPEIEGAGLCPDCGGVTKKYAGPVIFEHCNGCGLFIDRVHQVWQNYPFSSRGR